LQDLLQQGAPDALPPTGRLDGQGNDLGFVQEARPKHMGEMRGEVQNPARGVGPQQKGRHPAVGPTSRIGFGLGFRDGALILEGSAPDQEGPRCATSRTVSR
jgi:hypothetical protein